MDMANTAITFVMNIVTQIMGWAGGFFGAILPTGTATEDKKNQFIKYGMILVGLVVVAKVFRVNIGGKGGKK